MSTEPIATPAAGSADRRFLARDLLVVSVVALAVRGLAALLVDYPPYTDAAYYTMVADQLVNGHGLAAPVMWSWLEVGSQIPAHPVLPIPSNTHWMPLTSFVATASMAVLGTSYRAAELPFVLLSAALVPFTYLVGWELWRSRRVAAGAAVLALLAGPLLLMYPMVANFAVFGVPGAIALYAATRAVRSPQPEAWLLLSGVAAGVATLARVDGLLLVVAPAVAWAMRAHERGVVRSLMGGFGSAAAYLAVLSPWLIRNAATFGTPFPSAGGNFLWISSYNEQFAIGHQTSAATYFAANTPMAIIGSKLESWLDLLGKTAILAGGVFVIFFLAGLWLERHNRSLRPFIVYWLFMFAVMGLVFTFHAPHGAFYHSAPAWLPFALPLAVASLPPTCSALSRWWRFLGRPATHRFLLVVGLAGALVLSLVGSAVILDQWRTSHRQDLAAAGFLRDRGQTAAVVMSDDPAGLWQASGNPGIAIPFDPYPVVARAARAYGARWLVVNIRPGESGDPLGLWQGGDSVDGEGNRADWLATTPTFEAAGVRVYEILPVPRS
ncbi:MAG: glycosyltransferase family 39 protein [Chloroflexota bacterium]|nr:glycosyltransferase family 39 protein [Chloroflexota bacterium]